MLFKTIMSMLSLILLFSVSGCDVFNPSDETAEVITRGDKIFIKDRTGKEWDVTHAVSEYGFEADKFQFGLGPNAIRPILNPKMVSPGSAGYPGNNEDFLVIGTTLSGDTRAYPLNVLSRHEVADEVFQDTHVAVAY